MKAAAEFPSLECSAAKWEAAKPEKEWLVALCDKARMSWFQNGNWRVYPGTSKGGAPTPLFFVSVATKGLS